MLLLMLGAAAVAAQSPDTRPEGKSVIEELLELERSSSGRLPKKVVDAGREGNEQLGRSGILETALNVGDKMPSFVLGDARGQEVSSAGLLRKGPIVLVFYRGAWCPYCNLYLRGLQRRIGEFRALGAELVAVSVEPPDRSLKVVVDNKLDFTVLSDPELATAREFGIVYEVPQVVNDAVIELGFDIAEYNRAEKAELPLSATYVVSRSGRIEYAFLEIDYKKRADPDDILTALKRLAESASGTEVR